MAKYSDTSLVALDGNAAASTSAYATAEVIAIYPITPSSVMGEIADEMAANGKKNAWGIVPVVVELQSEGGASASVHGALQVGALTTTFTASQGLLLMIPSMYKIAGELCPGVIHISARALSSHALSIFGDHQDVMAVRATGFGMLASANQQEVMDLAAIAHRASLMSRVPFVHFFDGFRTSHEIQLIRTLPDEFYSEFISFDLISGKRERGMDPRHPDIRGTAQNPDVYFQGRETVNKYYKRAVNAVVNSMELFEELTGRSYRPFEYRGAEDADKVVILMASGCDTVEETINYMNSNGHKVGMVRVLISCISWLV